MKSNLLKLFFITSAAVMAYTGNPWLLFTAGWFLRSAFAVKDNNEEN